MQQSKLIRLLSSLSAAEARRFESFVQSPYHNTLDKAVALVQYLLAFYPDFSSPALEAELISERIFGSSAESLQPLHDLSSHLTRLLEQFWAIEQIKSNPKELQYQLSEALLSPERMWHHNKIWEKGRKTGEPEEKDAGYWLREYKYWEQGMRQAQQLKKRQTKDFLDSRLEMTMASLDRFYLIQKLVLCCEAINRSKILNTEFAPELLQEVSHYLTSSKSELSQVPLIQLYFQVLTLLQAANDEEYRKLLDLLVIHQDHISRNTGFALYTYAQNHCIRQINQGRSAFLDELFLLYKTLLQRAYLLEEDGSLAHWHYKNITTVALRLKEFDWVSIFLEEYRDKLSAELRESVYTYNLAALHYEQGAYKSALKLLQQTDFTDVYYALSAKSMLLKIYYELEDEEALGYAIQAFDVYLRRNQEISKDHFLIHKNLLRFTKKIHRFRIRYASLSASEQKSRAAKLEAELNSASSVANLSWLQAKLADISS
ncbi:MAG: hypothetical protein NWR72_10855 [Bacteroidia bacterium]|nr:hypothetical protein [Bacteroidia bacterium]